MPLYMATYIYQSVFSIRIVDTMYQGFINNRTQFPNRYHSLLTLCLCRWKSSYVMYRRTSKRSYQIRGKREGPTLYNRTIPLISISKGSTFFRTFKTLWRALSKKMMAWMTQTNRYTLDTVRMKAIIMFIYKIFLVSSEFLYSEWEITSMMPNISCNITKQWSLILGNFIFILFYIIPSAYVSQLLTMETERFSVPEVLFHPSDVGIEQAGIAEATWQGLQCLDTVSTLVPTDY
jgi:hypothetical protein